MKKNKETSLSKTGNNPEYILDEDLVSYSKLDLVYYPTFSSQICKVTSYTGDTQLLCRPEKFIWKLFSIEK